MNLIATPLLAIAPFINIGGSILLSWILTAVIIAAVVWFVTYIVTQIAGPKPPIPEGARWIVWTVVVILLLLFVAAALGFRIP